MKIFLLKLFCSSKKVFIINQVQHPKKVYRTKQKKVYNEK